jgi:hypothetical protein
MRETKVRPVRIRARADLAAVAALKAFDPVLAGLYVTRGITAASELDLALQRLAPIGSLNGVDVLTCRVFRLPLPRSAGRTILKHF